MYQMINRIIVMSLLAVSWGLIADSEWAAGAQTPGGFYRGKTFLVIGAYEPGNAPDLIMRAIGPFLSKEIGVTTLFEYKKTDEGINYLYNKAKRDGLTVGIKTTDAIIANDILKAPGTRYETDKFHFVADVYPNIKTFQMSPKLPYRTLDALRKANPKGLRAGATSAKGSYAVSAAVIFEILGLDGKIISGFKGKAELTLALARGELDFMVTSDKVAMRDEQNGYIINLFTLGEKRGLAVPHAPTLSELGVKIPKELAAAYKFVTSGGVAVALPPAVPQERVAYLRKAFQVVGKNSDLQKEIARRTGLGTVFVPGEKLQEEMTEMKADEKIAVQLDTVFKKYTAVR